MVYSYQILCDYLMKAHYKHLLDMSQTGKYLNEKKFSTIAVAAIHVYVLLAVPLHFNKLKLYWT